LTQLSDLLTIHEALTGDETSHWKTVMDLKYETLIKNGTWKLVDSPPNRTIISIKWLFCRKYNCDGSLARYKARFVTHGFSQQAGIDFTETFSPVIKMTSLRLLLAFATFYNFHIHQMDVVTAFLNGLLHEEIYIDHPEGYSQFGQEHKVCRLLKSLYGLKPVPRMWYELFDTFLLSQGFHRCTLDTSVYIKRQGSYILLLDLYVNDLVLIANDLKYLCIYKQICTQRFSMMDNNELAYILSVQVRRDRASNTLILTQEKYIFDLLTKFNP